MLLYSRVLRTRLRIYWLPANKHYLPNYLNAGFQPMVCLYAILGAGQELFYHRTDRLPVGAVVVVPVHVVRVEAQVVRAARVVVVVERRRPIVAVAASVVQVRIVAIPSNGKEDVSVSEAVGANDGHSSSTGFHLAFVACILHFIYNVTRHAFATVTVSPLPVSFV